MMAVDQDGRPDRRAGYAVGVVVDVAEDDFNKSSCQACY